MSLAAMLQDVGDQNLLQIKDSDFKALMNDEVVEGQDGDMEALEERAPVLVSPVADENESLIDMVFLHRVGSACLSPLPRSSVDLTMTKSVTFSDGRKVEVHFDNCFHSSGKHRCYIACPCSGAGGHHFECYKYSQVDRPCAIFCTDGKSRCEKKVYVLHVYMFMARVA